VIAIGRQLAAALAAAHTKGVIHQDLKPANIHLTVDGSVKVLDFGIARASAAFTTTSATHLNADMAEDRTGPRAGTPGYMSPEQMLGQTIDTRSDIFSLGVVLFEMATGARAFSSRDPQALVAALARPIRRADDVNPRVPRSLGEVIATAVEVDPERRYHSAAMLGAALEAVERELHVAASPRAEVAAPTRRRRLRWVYALALTPLILSSLGFINTSAFNMTLQRSGPFASEPKYMYFVWGLKSVVPVLIYMAIATTIAATLLFAVRLLRLVQPVDRAILRMRTHANRLAVTLGLDDPVALAEATAAFGLVALGLVLWGYWDLIRAWSTYVDLMTPEQMRLLAPNNDRHQSLYRIVLEVLVLVSGLSLFKIWQLRPQRDARAVGAIAVAVMVPVLCVVLNELPYRILFQNEFERIDLQGSRCYIVGEHDEDWLVFCPDHASPRNRIIRRTDPGIHKVGTIESIFTAGDVDR
jgi:hypothetical protein